MNPAAMNDLLSLDRWDGLTSATRQRTAEALASRLPPPWKLLGLEEHALGDQRHDVAFFDWNGTRFALVPGGEVTLGYDWSEPFVPTDAQREQWRWTQEEYDLPELETYLDQCLTPLRTVSLAPFLLEVTATEWGLEPISEKPGSFMVKRATLETVQEAVAAQCFRLPTADQWEHACAAGSRTLWRWGNDCPLDCYPSGNTAAEQSSWNDHRLPNAFGLKIGIDPYDWEFCDAPAILRGGDGGGMICGGTGYLSGWLTLATSFWFRDLVVAYEDEAIPGAHLRRGYSLPL